MLVKYKKTFKKIAMGLLSFMPTERELKKLLHTMQRYEDNPTWQLYLWKKEEDIVGLVGVEVAGDSFVIQHMTVDPSHRREGIGRAMAEEIQQLMQHRDMHTTKETELFLKKYFLQEQVFPAGEANLKITGVLI